MRLQTQKINTNMNLKDSVLESKHLFQLHAMLEETILIKQSKNYGIITKLSLLYYDLLKFYFI